MINFRPRHFACWLLAALLVLPFTATGAVWFQDDFEAYAPGTNLIGQGGWVGTGINLVNSATHLSGTSLLGPPNSGLSQLNVFGHSVGGALSAGEIYTLSFSAYAQTTTPVSHSSGLGIGNTAATLTGSFANGAMWVPVEYAFNSFGWRFDARQLTGGSGDYVTLSGGYDAIENLEVVIDTLAMEVYGRYDFGSGLLDTVHYSITAAQLAGIDAVAGYADYRGQNYGASTPYGKTFSNAEYDNIQFASSAAANVPAPSVLTLLLAGLLALGVRRRC